MHTEVTALFPGKLSSGLCSMAVLGQGDAHRGNCLVSWEIVQRPLQYGGLGILNLEFLGWALRIRWLLLQKTDSSGPWAGLPVQEHRSAKALFDVAVVSV
ncbi:hypothetical protein U9M48_036178, partial [Paspalum notatum var. saurae]